MDQTKTVVFTTQVNEIGTEAKDFASINMMIFFGDEAPAALRSSCYLINVASVQQTIKPGMTLVIDQQAYRITAVGGEVQTNLSNLGHISVVFNGATTPELAGTMYVEAKDYPKVGVGSQVKILG
ncbi:PTS glucitol/sorbitol transporter subunit IIA [Loigolactobacillus jiayinensis]|uniref:PTS glucitol/sorbitol transporter subunit IIA n=1 Tax=Loigolactobacillus jiayinensis TaxID=2486016 RepID=A0ABW1RDW3_9LACO|nr:PTS glucitol/sorbitol transporter subunit IIA [Loigolactobacillus jiayinensis]